MQRPESNVGSILLFGSGETAPSSRRIWASLLERDEHPWRIAILETPAGFELNSTQVAERVAQYLQRRFAHLIADIQILPARGRESPYSTDDLEYAQRLAQANLIYAGAGSPTYAVRQLSGSLLWRTILAAHTHGASLVFASAAAIAISTLALPVYEIYKAGHPLHWHPGLDLAALYEARLVIIPHWNNREGGAHLDTRYCFMGWPRFKRLRAMLPPNMPILGIDEHTAILWKPGEGDADVLGKGMATVIRGIEQEIFPTGSKIPIETIGWQMPKPLAWPAGLTPPSTMSPPPSPPTHVLALVEQREKARRRRDWETADRLRAEIATLGWRVLDSPEGPILEPLARV